MLKTISLNYQLQNVSLIHQINLTFLPGILYGVLGPNGAGKSTLLKTIAGIWAPTSGEVLWEGQAIHNRSRQEVSRLISLVFQNPASNFDFTVNEMVSMGRYLFREDKCDIETSLRLADVWDLRNRKMCQLSGGERQRVFIARALATEAPILLLDEPTTYLDLRHQLEIWHLLQSLSNKGKLIIVSTHDLVAANRFCDELIVLNQGKCVSRGVSQSTLTPAVMEKVFGIKSVSHNDVNFGLSNR